MRIFFPLVCIFLLGACALDRGNVVLTSPEATPAAIATAMPAVPPAAVPEPTPMDLFRAMAPPEGPKFTSLFDKPAADEVSRMKRLEDSVQALRNDLDTVVPAVTHIIADQKQVQKQAEITAQPQSLTPPAAQAPTPAPTAQAVKMIGAVKGIRFSDDKDKTRIVLDMTADGGLMARTENNGKTLVISMTRMNWLGPKSWDADNAQLISGYRVDNGTLSITLMYESFIKAQQVLPPGPKNANHRLVIDLFSKDVHNK